MKKLTLLILSCLLVISAFCLSAIANSSEYNIAILRDIVEEEDGFNVSTSRPEYKATLIIDGEEETVVLNDNGYAIVGENNYTAKTAYAKFRLSVTSENLAEYKYTIVSNYYETDDGYVLTIDGVPNSNTDIMVTGTLSYNSNTMLYSIGGYNLVLLDESSRLFYTYLDDRTGDFKHLGYYTKDTITEKSFKLPISGNAYLTKGTVNGTYILKAAMLSGENTDDVVDYTIDGSQILYAYADSAAIIDEGSGNAYYEYSFMDNETLTNNEPFLYTGKTYDKATSTEAGCFYGWSENTKKYVKIDTETGLDSFKPVVMSGMNRIGSSYYLRCKNGDALKISDDVKIWGLAKNNDEYVTLTRDELSEMIAMVNDYNSTGGETIVANAILVRSLDEDEEWVVSSIIVEIFKEIKTGDVVSVNGTIFGNDNPLEPSGFISLQNVRVQKGKEVNVPIILSDNMELTDLQLKVSYDEGLELVNVTQGEALSNLTFSVKEDVNLVWEGLGYKKDSSNGEIAILTFKAKEDTNVGDYAVKVEVVNVYDVRRSKAWMPNTEGKISVKDYVIGDVNSSGEVDLADVITLRRYLVGGYNITYNEENLDINNNGKVDLADVITLRRHLVGGYGIELK